MNKAGYEKKIALLEKKLIQSIIKDSND